MGCVKIWQDITATQNVIILLRMLMIKVIKNLHADKIKQY
jgi:hypothetical protein